MKHFGIISPPVYGHINPMASLGRELKKQGHQVTFFHIPDIEKKILSEGLEFCSIGQSDHPLGSLPESVAQIGKLNGLDALRFTIKAIAKTTNMFCRDAPDAIKAAGVDVLLVDQTEPVGGTIAEYLDLPFITICCALAINREPYIPPVFTPWNYHKTWWASLRNQIGYFLFDRLTQPIQNVISEYREEWGLPPYKHIDDSLSLLAQISQQPPEFDFPRERLPENFYYTGPLRNFSPQAVSFPYDKLTEKPLIYASLGTQQNTKEKLFYTIAAACADLDVQLVIAHGGGMREEIAQSLPGSPLVVSYAPQWELLARADLTITHAGLNTVLDSLSHGVPLITIPITYEQPAIAARISCLEVGAVLPLNQVSVHRLNVLVQKVLGDDSYAQKAEKLKNSIEQAGGVKRATEIIEQSLKKVSNFTKI